MQSSFPLGTFFVEAPQGAPTQSFIGTLDSATGVLTPLLTQRDGIVDPTALRSSGGSAESGFEKDEMAGPDSNADRLNAV